jgi:predicted KAP-like P-loop ATPase
MNHPMSENLTNLLTTFSMLANKTATHSADMTKLMDFTIQAHLERSSLDESALREILESQNWSEDKALELSEKYDFGREILARLDK